MRPELEEKLQALRSQQESAVEAAKIKFLTEAVKAFDGLTDLSPIEKRQLKIHKTHLEKYTKS